MLLHKRISSIIVLLLLSAVSYSQKGESGEGLNAEQVDSVIQERVEEDDEFIRDWLGRSTYPSDSEDEDRLEWVRSNWDAASSLVRKWREEGELEE